MAFEIERVLYQAEDFLIRSFGSSAARAAQKRRAQRKMQEFLRRLRRSGLLLVAILAALLAYSILVAPIGFVTWLVAIPTAFLFAFLSLFWPTRQRAEAEPAAPSAALEELAGRAADGLLDRWDDLPGRAIPAADTIIARLHELQPHLAGIDSDPILAGDAQRLICRHLPKLVDSYLALPESARAPGSDSSRRFAESLGVVAEEFDELLDRCCRDRHLSFETQRRFIESRYQDDERLGSDEPKH